MNAIKMILACCLFIPTLVSADIYKCTSPEGKVSFTGTPCASGMKAEIKAEGGTGASSSVPNYKNIDTLLSNLKCDKFAKVLDVLPSKANFESLVAEYFSNPAKYDSLLKQARAQDPGQAKYSDGYLVKGSCSIALKDGDVFSINAYTNQPAENKSLNRSSVIGAFTRANYPINGENLRQYQSNSYHSLETKWTSSQGFSCSYSLGDNNSDEEVWMYLSCVKN